MNFKRRAMASMPETAELIRLGDKKKWAEIETSKLTTKQNKNCEIHRYTSDRYTKTIYIYIK